VLMNDSASKWRGVLIEPSWRMMRPVSASAM
jgi:hypothetical protein